MKRLPEVGELSLAAAAMAYAEAGWAIFPLSPRGKVPFGEGHSCYTHGFKDASSDIAKVKLWWSVEPEANIGLPTGPKNGVLAIDLDEREREDKHGLQDLYLLEQEVGELPRGPLQQTPSGGQHRLFANPEHVKLACSAGEIAPGIDLRGAGGYIVVAPSFIEETADTPYSGTYLWVRRGDLVSLPADWINVLLRRGKRARDKKPDGADFDPFSKERNKTLYAFGCHLQSTGLTGDKLENDLRAANELFDKGPLPGQEFGKVLKQVLRNEKSRKHGELLRDKGSRYIWCVGRLRFYDQSTGVFLDKPQFDSLFAPEFGKTAASAEVLRSPGLTRVQDTVVAPDQPFIFERKEPGREGAVKYLNTYVASGVEPREGDVTPWLEHLDYLFGDDAEDLAHAKLWMAHLVQHPGAKIQHALLVGGKQGIGKTYLGKVMRDLVGPVHTSTLTPQMLQNRFNSWIENSLLIMVEEVCETSNRRLIENLKVMITDNRVRIERKGAESFEARNLANFIMFTNHDDALDLWGDDRRVWVYMSKAVKRPPAYYNELMTWTQAHHAEILAHLLSLEVPPGFGNSHAPMNQSKEAMISAVRDDVSDRLAEAWETNISPLNGDLMSVVEIGQWFRDQRYRTVPSLQRLANLLRELGAVSLGRSRTRDDLNGPRLYCRPDAAARFAQCSPRDLWERWCEQVERRSEDPGF